MCDEEDRCIEDETDQTDSQLLLTDLPIEIFVHICSFLDSSTLVHSLSLVCKQFHEILRDNSLWKVRINQVWPDAVYPILPPAEDDETFWKLSCVALEKQKLLWKNEYSMEQLLLCGVQYCTIDSLLLMKDGNICISGARDRSLVCWQLPMKKNETVSYTRTNFAHNGWIWDLAAIGDTVYSCSWDQTIKAWTLTNCSLIHIKTYEMYMRLKLVIFAAFVMGRPSEEGTNIFPFFKRLMIVSGALLCVASCPELAIFATGSFCKTILVFDPRLNYTPIVKYRPHTRAVIKLAMNSNFIVSASEDRTVSIWDQRAGRTMKNVTISEESFPMSMCMERDLVCVGDGSAKLHILDPKNGFEPVKSYTTEHRRGINGVHCVGGCLITSSMDETVRISSLTDPPQHIVTLKSSYGEIASTDYQNDVLAVSGTRGIEIWRPRSRIECKNCRCTTN